MQTSIALLDLCLHVPLYAFIGSLYKIRVVIYVRSQSLAIFNLIKQRVEPKQVDGTALAPWCSKGAMQIIPSHTRTSVVAPEGRRAEIMACEMTTDLY